MQKRNRLLTLNLIFVIFFLYLPIFFLMLMSFNGSSLPTVWGGFSTKWYVSLMGKTALFQGAANTLIVASLSSGIATVLGTLMALGVHRLRGTLFLDALLMAPMLIPDIIIAVSLLSIFTLIDFKMGLHSVIMSHVVFNIAFVCAIVRSRLKGFDESMIEASRDLGAGALTTFWRVRLPMLMPGMIAGFLLAFTLSFDEFIIAFFTAGPRQSAATLPMHIYSMVRFGVKPEVNAIATILLAASFLMVILALRKGKEVIH